jgi:hypothetical protein
MFRPVEPFIEGNSKITGGVDPMDWLSEEMYCSGVVLKHIPGLNSQTLGLHREQPYSLETNHVLAQLQIHMFSFLIG